MADNLNKTELVAAVAAASGQSQATVSSVVDAFFSTISETAARTGRNPQTGAEISIPAGHRVKLTAGSKLKAAVK
jgi:DNA-binding protein HU-beta